MARPEFKPTAAQRRQVAVLAAAKMAEDQIAASVGISRPTLRKHFTEELASGKAQRNAAVIQAIYKQALAGNVSAQRLWVKVAGLDSPALPGKSEGSSVPVTSKRGKKEIEQENAESVGGDGSDWGDDLAFGGARLN